MDPGLVVDLGAGAGAYLGTLLDRFPSARGLWVDASEPMQARARERLAAAGDRVDFVLADLRRPEDLPMDGADVVVTSRAVHHFTPEVIRRMYDAVHRGLHPGGFFFNLDHFAVPPGWEERYRRIRPLFVPPRGDREPHDHDAPPQPLADHLGWLAAAGFEPPDVPWRAFWTALVGARKQG
jgi:SAM-dependent methyltransferase